MPKAEAGTPKAIGKAIKAKGLQKLKFFCQVCQKQCRDANGFKCHMNSENHQRQMLIVAENPGRFLNEYSSEFLKGFMHLFRTRFGSKRVFANQVYQEYIKDRYHMHMNSTKWLTLGSFVAWLGKNGYAEVDHTERGWYITYIDRDPETLRRQELSKRRDKCEKDYDERMRDIINEQIERGKELSRPTEEPKEEDKLLRREAENDKIVLKLDLNKKPISEKKEPASSSGTGESKKTWSTDLLEDTLDQDKQDEKPSSSNKSSSSQPEFRVPKTPKISSKSQKELRRSVLDEIIEEEESKKHIKRKENWIEKNLVVKVVTKKVPEKYQKKKGVIERVEDRFLAHVRMSESNALIKIDQNDLETVIPKEGNLVKIVNGGYHGEIAELVRVDQKAINATVRIEKGYHKDKEVVVEFEDICKFVQ